MANYQVPRSDPANGVVTVTDGQIGVSQPAVAVPLVGQNSTNYGTAVATTQVHLLENFANGSPPGEPLEGQLWYDNSNGILNINTGGDGTLAVWEPVSGTGGGGQDNTASNLGTSTVGAVGLFAQKVGVDLQFKSLVSGTPSDIVLTSSAGNITISYVGSGGGGGEVNDGVNLGAGNQVFAGKTGVDLLFRTLTAGANVTLTQGADTIQIDATGGGTGGEVNTASNIGTGAGQVFAQKNGVDLQFRTLKAGTDISISTSGNEVTIASTGGGGGTSWDGVSGSTPSLGGDLLTNANDIVFEDTTGDGVDPVRVSANNDFGRLFYMGPADQLSTFSRTFLFNTNYNPNNSNANRSVIFGTGGNVSVSNGVTPSGPQDLTTKAYVDAKPTPNYSTTQLWSGSSSGGTFTLSSAYTNFDQLVCVVNRTSGTGTGIRGQHMFDRRTISTTFKYAMAHQPAGDTGSVSIKFNGGTSFTVSDSTNQTVLVSVSGIKFS
jgi:hypothetical protein